MITLYPFQQKFLEDPKNDYAILAYETGTGKTFTAHHWAHQKQRAASLVVICPKQILKHWQETEPDAHTYSFEQFTKAYKEQTLPTDPTAIIVDEADNMASPLFVAQKRSQRAEALYTYLQTNLQAHVLLLTATPVRSTPWNMHTLLIYTQHMDPKHWKEYRDEYFSLQHMPYLPRPAWLPHKNWRPRMQELINKYCHVALMSDVVDLPPTTHTVINLPKPNYEKNIEWEPAKQFVGDHRLEQHTKGPEIKKIARGYRKVVVVAHYRLQIDELYTQLSKDRQTYVLDGRSTDISQIIKDAESDPECYFIVQASVGAGFELPSFSCMIFASQGYAVRDYMQMIGRIRRINALKPVIYYYLHGGRCDKAIYKNVQSGTDFVPSVYMAHAGDK